MVITPFLIAHDLSSLFQLFRVSRKPTLTRRRKHLFSNLLQQAGNTATLLIPFSFVQLKLSHLFGDTDIRIQFCLATRTFGSKSAYNNYQNPSLAGWRPESIRSNLNCLAQCHKPTNSTHPQLSELHSVPSSISSTHSQPILLGVLHVFSTSCLRTVCPVLSVSRHSFASSQH